MNLEKLKAGNVFKNYKAMCTELGIPIKNGSRGKEYQFRNIKRYCLLHKDGQKIIIDEVFDIPLPKIDGRGRSIGSRTNHQKYESLDKTNPNLLTEWDYCKNDVTPEMTSKGSNYNAWWVCNECGYKWQSTVSHRACSEKGCPVCKGSKGEKEIALYLREKSIKFKVQFKFDDLVGLGNSQLKFDFSIFKNDELVCLIEYDGQYHFKDKNDDEENYNVLHEHDLRKDEYCNLNNIPLIRIPYWRFKHIEIILDTMVMTLNL